MAHPGDGTATRTITLEEHYATPAFMEGPGRQRKQQAQAISAHPQVVATYLRENVHYTFSGFKYTPAFLDLLLQVGVDRIMFSADYPYASLAEARVPPSAPGQPGR